MKRPHRLLVLAPHRDTRVLMQAWSAELFKSGFLGAWSFPWVIPIAEVKRHLSLSELKELGIVLRNNFTEKKITCGKAEICEFPAYIDKNISILGPAVNLNLSEAFFRPIKGLSKYRFSPLVLGSALAEKPLLDDIPCPPEISFGASALANMEMLPLSQGNVLSFEWKIGQPCWLPKKREK